MHAVIYTDTCMKSFHKVIRCMDGIRNNDLSQGWCMDGIHTMTFAKDFHGICPFFGTIQISQYTCIGMLNV